MKLFTYKFALFKNHPSKKKCFLFAFSKKKKACMCVYLGLELNIKIDKICKKLVFLEYILIFKHLFCLENTEVFLFFITCVQIGEPITFSLLRFLNITKLLISKICLT